jgi:hypothetical protein
MDNPHRFVPRFAQRRAFGEIDVYGEYVVQILREERRAQQRERRGAKAQHDGAR